MTAVVRTRGCVSARTPIPRIKAVPRGQGGPIFNRREACCGKSGGGGDRCGEKGRNRLWTSKYDEQVSQPRGRQSMQCSPSPVTGNGGSPQKVSPERNDDIAFVRGKSFLNPTLPTNLAETCWVKVDFTTHSQTADNFGLPTWVAPRERTERTDPGSPPFSCDHLLNIN